MAIYRTSLDLTLMKEQTFETVIGNKTFSATFTDLAEQANGSALVRYGDTTVLTTAVMSRGESDKDYLPLSVEYEEKFYAAGQILGSRFVRREGRPSDGAILSGRVIDRTIRPLFDSSLRNDIQVVASVLSINEDDPDVLGINAASIALLVSDIPWGGPVSAVRVGKKKGKGAFVINPNYEFRSSVDIELDVLLCGRNNTVTMIEVAANEVSEDTLLKSFEYGLQEIEKIQAFQNSFREKVGKEKQNSTRKEVPEIVGALFGPFAERFPHAVFSGAPGKHMMGELKKEYIARVREEHPELARDADDYFESRVEALMRERAIKLGERVDGRALDEVRPLFAKAGGVSAMLHGSGIFYRGGTHVFSALTLGGPEDSQVIDSIEEPDTKKRFMHHYNFPPFSVGETGRIGGLNRRMVGHGALAEKALEAVIPPQETFPYTIRLVSEAFASNGSTSMGSVCASSLALMDGGVPISNPVAGIAMGVMYKNENEYAVLTDIQGPEDHHGDMDFKVAGTKNGVTAIQLDVKVEGVPVSVLKGALDDAKAARLHILKVMLEAIPEPRKEMSPRAPKIISLTVPPDMIGMVIGGQGKNIKKIQEDTGVEGITIEDDGRVFITGKGDAPLKAEKIIKEMTRVFKPGEVIEGKVTRILDFGAFVRLSSRTEGLVHISEIAPFRIDRVADAVAIGEMVRVSVKEIDSEGRVNLSLKDADPEFAVRKGLKPSERTARGNGLHRDNKKFG